MRYRNKPMTLLIIGLPILVASAYYGYVTKEKDNTEISPVPLTPAIEQAVEDKEYNVFEFDNNVVSASIVYGVSYSKSFDITNVKENTKTASVILTEYDAEGKQLSRSATTSVLYTNDPISGKFSIESKDDKWFMSTSVDGSQISYDIAAFDTSDTSIKISTDSNIGSIAMGEKKLIAVLVQSDSDNSIYNLEYIGIDEIKSKIKSPCVTLEFLLLDNMDASPLDFYEE